MLLSMSTSVYCQAPPNVLGEEMAKGAAGADGRGDAYGALARLVADIFRR